MRSVALGCFIALVALAAPAQAATMSECAAQWKAAKAAKQTEGKTYKEFSKACMGATTAQADAPKADASKSNDLAKQAGGDDVSPATGKKARTKKSKSDTGAETEKPSAKEAKKPTKPVSAAVTRQRECGAEWKADKAAGKVEKGMTWPKYWSACSKRKKGESA